MYDRYTVTVFTMTTVLFSVLSAIELSTCSTDKLMMAVYEVKLQLKDVNIEILKLKCQNDELKEQIRCQNSLLTNTVEKVSEVVTQLGLVRKDFSSYQVHIQHKQDQIVSKQDLIHSTLMGDQLNPPSAVMTGPIMSPRTASIRSFSHPPTMVPYEDENEDLESLMRSVFSEIDFNIEFGGQDSGILLHSQSFSTHISTARDGYLLPKPFYSPAALNTNISCLLSSKPIYSPAALNTSNCNVMSLN